MFAHPTIFQCPKGWPIKAPYIPTKRFQTFLMILSSTNSSSLSVSQFLSFLSSHSCTLLVIHLATMLTMCPNHLQQPNPHSFSVAILYSEILIFLSVSILLFPNTSLTKSNSIACILCITVTVFLTPHSQTSTKAEVYLQ